MSSQEEKQQKTALKTLWKKVLKAHAHVVILQDNAGKVKMFSNFDDPKDLAYTLTYMANDLLGKIDSFDDLVEDKVREKIKEKADQEIDELAEEFEKED